MKLLAPLVALALAACATSPLPEPSGPTAGFGQVAATGGPRVRPLELLEDSRCPINARCVWAGRLRLRAAVFGPDWRQDRELTLGEPVAIAGGRLTLIAAQPGKLAGAELDPAAYRFTFQFEPGL